MFIRINDGVAGIRRPNLLNIDQETNHSSLCTGLQD